jgi:hypothetical protein
MFKLAGPVPVCDSSTTAALSNKLKIAQNTKYILCEELCEDMFSPNKKRQMSLYGESQFDSQLSELLQLINT